MFYRNVKQLDGKVLQANHNDILRAPSRPWASCECVHERHRCPTLISLWKWGSESLEKAIGEVTGVMMCVCFVLPSIRQSEVTHNPTEVLTNRYAIMGHVYPTVPVAQIRVQNIRASILSLCTYTPTACLILSLFSNPFLSPYYI